MNHPAIARLEDRLQTTVTVTRRRTSLGYIFTVRPDGFSAIGQSTTVHMAVEAFLKNAGLETA